MKYHYAYRALGKTVKGTLELTSTDEREAKALMRRVYPDKRIELKPEGGTVEDPAPTEKEE